MKTLKEISNMNPNNDIVVDLKAQKGNVLNWSDNIEIIIGKTSKEVKRKSAYKFGLCLKAD